MAGEKEEKDDKDEAELVVVTDDPKNLDAEMGDEDVLPGQKDKRADSREEESDESDDDEDEQDEEEEARLGASEETEAEDEAKAKKRSDHRSRRQRKKEAEQRLRRERDFLEKRNDQLERQIQALAQGQQVISKRQEESEKSLLDREIAHTESTIRKAEQVYAEAISAQKGEEAAEAQRIRDKLRDDLKEMKGRREAADRDDEGGETEGRPERKRPAVDPRAVANVRKWHKDHQWFDFGRRDMDSKIAGAIDDQLAAEGWDPTKQDYFDEFNERIAKYLPHRKLKAKKPNGRDDSDDEDEEEGQEEESGVSRRPKAKAKGNGKDLKTPAGGPKFRTGGPGRDLKSNEVFLSRDRIEAMKELGVWEDPKLRAKYLKRYREYDRNNNA